MALALVSRDFWGILAFSHTLVWVWLVDGVQGCEDGSEMQQSQGWSGVGVWVSSLFLDLRCVVRAAICSHLASLTGRRTHSTSFRNEVVSQLSEIRAFFHFMGMERLVEKMVFKIKPI